MKRPRPILYIYRPDGVFCSAANLHRALHGRREIRTSTDDFGRVVHKMFEYPGIPHRDIIREPKQRFMQITILIFIGVTFWKTCQEE